MKNKCPKCESTDVAKNGTKNGVQNYKCRDCGRYFTAASSSSESSKPKNKKMAGTPLDKFRKSYDVVFILSQVPEKFEDDVLYEKSDVMALAGLSAGFPGIGTVLESESWRSYVGRAG